MRVKIGAIKIIAIKNYKLLFCTRKERTKKVKQEKRKRERKMNCFFNENSYPTCNFILKKKKLKVLLEHLS